MGEEINDLLLQRFLPPPYMKNFSLRSALLNIPFLRNLNEMRFDPLRLIYDPAHLNRDYYERVRSDPEMEHQIGRLQNFRQIIQEIAEQKLPGDFIEFGTWQGFSMLWTAYFCQQFALFDRALIGIDGFVGLPNDEGVFTLGQFKNTSRKQCEHALRAAPELYPQVRRNISVHQSLFEKKEKMGALLRGRTFVFLHLDADLSRSTVEIFNRLQENNSLADTCYLLFDDYGCDTSLGDIVDDAMEAFRTQGWNVSVHSSTRLTKNFTLQRI